MLEGQRAWILLKEMKVDENYRPQFDNSAIAVIMTRQDKAKKYEKMVSGEELLESW